MILAVMTLPQQLMISFLYRFSSTCGTLAGSFKTLFQKHGAQCPPEIQIMLENFLHCACDSIQNHYGDHEE